MDRQQIIEAIEQMTVIELADLVKELEEKFGVSAAAAVVAAGPVAGAAPAAEEEKTEFTVPVTFAPYSFMASTWALFRVNRSTESPSFSRYAPKIVPREPAP